jgi:uncharacterized membrane protein
MKVAMTNKEQPLSNEELNKLRKPVKNANIEHKTKLTRLERFAVWITDKVGSMGSFLIIFGWTMLWLGWNTLAPKDLRFDPFPPLFYSYLCQI